MVHNYETMFVVNPSVVTTDEELAPVMERFRQLVVDNGGEVLNISKWEKRRLAYEVAGQREGIYVLMFFKSEPSVQRELDRVLRISEEVIRHLIKRVEEKDIVEPPKPAAEEPAAPIDEAEAEPAPEDVIALLDESEVPEVVELEEFAEPAEAFEEDEFAEEEEAETVKPAEMADVEDAAVEGELEDDLAAEPEEESGPSKEEDEA